MTDKRIVVLSDEQSPYEDTALNEIVLDFIRDYEPDELWHVGDEMDAPEPARWSKGMAAEHAGEFWNHVLHTRAMMLAYKEALGDRPFHVSRSNHTQRVETYVRKYAPALTSLPDLRIEHLLQYAENDITYHRQVWDGLPGWVLAHGDESSTSPTAGGTALRLANKIGKSVVCGHTHRLGLIPHTTGALDDKQTIYGFEVGHRMDMRHAAYLNSWIADWQTGFGLLTMIDDRVYPTPVPVVDGKFMVDGYEYG